MRSDSNRTAVLLLDLQRAFVHPSGALSAVCGRSVSRSEPDLSGLLDSCDRLVRAAQERGMPVVVARTVLRADLADWALPRSWRSHVHGHPRESPIAGAWGAALMDGLDPGDGALGVVKRGLSAFQHTELDVVLGNLGVTGMIVAGGAVDYQLSATVRQGAALGYEQLVVSDAVYPSGSDDLATLRNRVGYLTAAEAVARIARGGAMPVRPTRQSLLVIDMQNDFVHPNGVMARNGHSTATDPDRLKLAENVIALVAAFHEAGLSVVFVRDVQTEHGRDTVLGPMMRRALPVPASERFIVDGTWGADYYAPLSPDERDTEIIKRGNSAFGFTPLHRTLRNLGVAECVVAGGAVAGCVGDTVHEAIGLGYECTVVADATYPPESPYLAVLAGLARIRDTADISHAINPDG